MTEFPILPPIQRTRGNTRIGQRTILPTATRRRHQIAQEREVAATVSLPGGVGDFSDIQQAIDFVNDLGGGTLFIKNGRYTISSPLIVYDNILIIGETAANCELDFSSTDNNIIQGELDEINNFTIERLTLSNCTNSNGAIYFGIDSDHTIIRRCFFEGNTVDLGLYSYSNLLVQLCKSRDSGTFFKGSKGIDFNHIVGNDIQDATSYVFDGSGTGGADQTEYKGNVIIDCENSIFFGDFSFSVIADNLIFWADKTSSGVIMDFNDSYQSNIYGNNIDASGAGVAAIDLNDSDENQFVGNVIFGDKDSTPVILVNNGSNDNKFTGNEIDAIGLSGSDGIKTVGSDRNVIVGNNISGADSGTAYAVNISDAGSDNNVVVGNRLGANTGDTNDSGTNSTIASNN